MPISRLLDERAVALPMALITLALLSTLMLAFASLARIEPVVAANHLRASQARSLADSGIELGLWALSHPSATGGIPEPMPGDVGVSPFDGRTFVGLGAGGFTVKVASDAGGDRYRRTITAVGWVPTNSGADRRPRAHRQVSLDAALVPPLALRTPCALCVLGALDVVGQVTIDGHNTDRACGDDTRFGAFTRDATTLTGPVTVAGGAGPSAASQPASAFDAITLTPAALDALKTLAWRNGTYFGPGYPRGGRVSDGSRTWNGRIAFDAGNPVADGVVFVDTTDGAPIAARAAVTLATAQLDAAALAARGGVFRGWLVVNGSLELTGGVSVQGTLYALDRLAVTATRESRIDGLAIGLNTSELATSRIEAAGGPLTMAFHCAHASAADRIPRGFALIPGTHREEAD
ncbi:MAG TPA: hypothetical protein VHT71_21320 [Methylomirabilota bacterium]|nr:hypothetical protein [Methylomirabilota bacterium]